MARSIPRNRRKRQKSRKYGNMYKSVQTLNQTTRDINKLCLGKISFQKTVRLKFSLDSEFLNVLYGKKRKPENAGINKKLLNIKINLLLTVTIIRKLLKNYQFGF